MQKDISKLTAEDIGVATGVLKMVKAVGELHRKCAVILPSGERRELPEVDNSPATTEVRTFCDESRAKHSLSPEELASLVIRAIFIERSSGTSGAASATLQPSAVSNAASEVVRSDAAM